MVFRKKVCVLFAGFVFAGLMFGITVPAGGRTEGEVDTELWLIPKESVVGDKSVANFRVDHLRGNLSDYPNKLTTALYWPNTNNTLFDTGLALSGNIKTPLVDRDSRESRDFSLILDGYFAEDFGFDYPIGTAGGSSRISFDEERMDYWVAKGIVNYGGFSYRAVFLLEEIKESSPIILQGISDPVIFGTIDEITAEARAELKKVQSGKLSFKDISARTSREILEAIPTKILEDQLEVTSNYGTGMELALSGMKVSGISVELKTRLGLVPNPPEMVRDDPGSGYDVFSAVGRYVGYTGSDIGVNGIGLGPVSLDTTSSFSAEGGFEETTVNFSLEEASEMLELEGTLTYSLEKKTVSLEPSLDLGWACFDVYSKIRPREMTEKQNGLTGISIKGYGINGIQLGNVKTSFIHSLGDNRLQRTKRQDDWRLRASDYDLIAESEFSYAGGSYAYEVTDYDGAISLEGGGGNLELAVDYYWGPSSSLFGLSELTGEAGYRLSNSFELVTGLVLDSDEGVQSIVMNTIYKW